MGKKYCFFILLLTSFLMLGCEKGEVLPVDEVHLVPMEFSANTLENDSGSNQKTYTYLTNIYWQSGDAIGVLSDGVSVSRFDLTSGDASTSATFQGSASASGPYYAIYPYQSGVTLEGNMIKNITLPRRQVATLNSFDPRCNIMVAKSEGTDFSFKQVCSYLKITTTFACKQISLKSNRNGIPVSGKCNVGIDGEDALSITSTTDTAIVSLVPPQGSTEFAAGTYWLAVFPGTLENGFLLSFTASDDKVYLEKYTGSLTFNRRYSYDFGSYGISSFSWSGIVDYVQLWDNGPYWATVNMGATSATGYGDFFAWGEIEPYYQTYSVNGRTMTATYRNGKTNGYVSTSYPITSQIWDASDVLLAQYDVACQLWGGNWTMPTDADFTGLISNCDVAHESSNGGFRFTGQGYYSDKSIFLPLGGGYNGATDNSSVTTGGYYWSSKRNVDNSYYFKISSTERPSVNSWTRYRGYMVRPVRRVQ